MCLKVSDKASVAGAQVTRTGEEDIAVGKLSMDTYKGHCGSLGVGALLSEMGSHCQQGNDTL